MLVVVIRAMQGKLVLCLSFLLFPHISLFSPIPPSISLSLLLPSTVQLYLCIVFDIHPSVTTFARECFIESRIVLVGSIDSCLCLIKHCAFNRNFESFKLFSTSMFRQIIWFDKLYCREIGVNLTNISH